MYAPFKTKFPEFFERLVVRPQYLHRRVRELSAAGHDIVMFSVKGTKENSYGLRRFLGKYIPISRGASYLLDGLKRYWEVFKNREILSTNLKALVGMSRSEFSTLFRTKGREELKEKGLTQSKNSNKKF